jgi:hypothetical protein
LDFFGETLPAATVFCTSFLRWSFSLPARLTLSIQNAVNQLMFRHYMIGQANNAFGIAGLGKT